MHKDKIVNIKEKVLWGSFLRNENRTREFFSKMRKLNRSINNKNIDNMLKII